MRSLEHTELNRAWNVCVFSENVAGLDSGNSSLCGICIASGSFGTVRSFREVEFSAFLSHGYTVVFCRVSTAFEMSSGSFCVCLPHFLEKVRDGLHLRHLHVPWFRFFCQQVSDAFNIALTGALIKE